MDRSSDRSIRHPLAPGVQPQGVGRGARVPGSQLGTGLGEVPIDGSTRRLAKNDHSFLISLAYDAQFSLAARDIREIQGGRLRDAHPRSVEDLENRPIPQTGRVLLGPLQQLGNMALDYVSREALLYLRPRHRRGGVPIDQALCLEVAEQGPCRRQAPCDGAPRCSLPRHRPYPGTQVAQPRRQRAAGGIEEAQEGPRVGHVRAHRMRREPAHASQVVLIGSEDLFAVHAPLRTFPWPPGLSAP